MVGAAAPSQTTASKLITCVLPDDGTHTLVLEALKGRENRAYQQLVMGTGNLADARIRPGTLPDAGFVRLVQIVTAAHEADALFDWLVVTARINRPGGGVILQAALSAATAFKIASEPPAK